MKRDPLQFPNDENGDTLWRMTEEGDDLSIPREVDFSVIFPNEDSALQFAVHLLRNEQKVSFGPYEGSPSMPWQVQAHATMLPTYENISGFEALLERDSAALGGRNDGWGCFSQP
jgi:hypothetical protein